jgi:poly(A) polymerase
MRLYQISQLVDTLCFYGKSSRSSQSASDLPLKVTENGASNLPSSLPPVVENYAKDRSEIRTPHLPFGENVNVATSAVAAQ